MTTAVSHALAERETVIGTRIKSVKLELLKDASEGRPLARSGVAERRFAKAYTDTLDQLANRMWTEMKRVMEETYTLPYAQLENDLQSLLCPNLRGIYLALCKSAETNAAGCYGQQVIPGFQAQYDKLESKFCNEIGIFCAALEARETRKGTNPVNNTSITVIGEGARAYSNSIDNSTNISNSNFDFRVLSNLVENKISDQELKAALKSKIAEMENSVAEKNTFRQKYAEFMSLAADHVSVFGPMIPALVEFAANHLK